jgi:ribonuclease T2
MKTAVAVAVASAAVASASLYNQSTDNHTCVLVPDYQSCSPEANPLTVDSCCVETFGGLLLSTQFWDVYTGREAEDQLLPETNWTIHGLWPDFWWVQLYHTAFWKPVANVF